MAPTAPAAEENLRGNARRKGDSLFAVRRIASFLALIGLLIWGLDTIITAGLRRLPTTIFGVTNRMMSGRINAEVVITGSSRAASHYDPRMIHRMTGLTTFNLGRNGSQTDMQLAVLRAYLKHNRRPKVILHNLDAFTLQTTHEVYYPAQYVPYLTEDEFYIPLLKINRESWKSRYLPLYGYIVEDMSYAWTLGLRAFLPQPPKDNLYNGFDPRDAKWTDEFDRFKASKTEGVSWEIEADGVKLMEELVEECHRRGTKLILVYSPEYGGMQALTKNRAQIFESFYAVAARRSVPVWDYSDWEHALTTAYFTNSQHLNADGAAAFSADLGARLQEYVQGGRRN